MEYKEKYSIESWWNWGITGRKILKLRFRFDPVPRTGVYNWNFRTLYKTPKIMQEKRMTFSCDRKLIRGKRSIKHLPDTNDDIVRSDVYIKRSWKKSNKVKKQYMKNL